MPRREAPPPSEVRLHDARDWLFDVRRVCGRPTILSFAKLGGTIPRHITMGRMVRWLRRASCRAAPVAVKLEEKAQDAAYRHMGHDRGWSVALL